MTFEGGFLIIFAFMFGVPLLYGLIRLAEWIAGRKLLPRWLLAAVVVGLPLSASLYLDSAGVVRPVKVTHKEEIINLGGNGSWSRSLNINVEFHAPGEILPTQLAVGCDAEMFDNLRVGQMTEARILDFGEVFKFARLKDRTTFSLIADLLPRSPRGPWRESTGAVRRITHITHYSTRRSYDELRWPFDIIQIEFTPDGKDQPVVAVDVVEAASVAGLAEGEKVKITWPEDNPRSARIVGAFPGAPWTNWFFIMGKSLALLAAFIALIAVVSFIWRLRKKRRSPRAF